MVAFIICMALVVVAVIAMVLSHVYSRTRGKEVRERKKRHFHLMRKAELDRLEQKVRTDCEDGEDLVASILDSIDVPPKHVFRDIIIEPYANGHHTEVDFIVIMKNGVFVLDVKSWEGSFRCEEKEAKKKARFYDLYMAEPGSGEYAKCKDSMQAINLNMGHFDCVKAYLTRLMCDGAFSDRTLNRLIRNMHSFVVFSNNNLEGRCARAVNANELAAKLLSYREDLYTHTVEIAAEAIRDNPCETTRDEHMEHLKDQYGAVQEHAAA